MLLRIFKGIQPFVLFLVLATGMVVWLKAILFPEEATFPFESQNQLLYYLAAKVFNERLILSVITGFLLSLLIGILLVRLNTTYFFISRRSYLPALFFLLGTGIFISLQRVNPVLVAGVFLIIAIDRMFGTYKYPKTSFQYFDAGILIGLGSLFYVNLIFYLPILWIGLSILRTFNWREWLVTIIGFLTPIFFAIATHYFIVGDTLELLSDLISSIFEPYHFGGFDLSHLLIFSFLGLLVLIFSIHMIYSFSGKKISSRKYLSIMLWIFILTGIIYFAVPSASIELIFILFIPLSYLFTHFFISIRSPWIGEILFFLFLAAIAVVQIL